MLSFSAVSLIYHKIGKLQTEDSELATSVIAAVRILSALSDANSWKSAVAVFSAADFLRHFTQKLQVCSWSNTEPNLKCLPWNDPLITDIKTKIKRIHHAFALYSTENSATINITYFLKICFINSGSYMKWRYSSSHLRSSCVRYVGISDCIN